jgi:hypothetical protein
MFFFLRALRLASLPSLLGAVSFAFAGAMAAQVAHFGLVAGMSWVPLQLLAVMRLSEPRTAASRLSWTGVLAGAAGLTILAGEPRALDDACVIVGIYAAWRIVRLGRHCGPAAVSVTAGAALGVCLGAVQWLPGLVAISASQRGASSMALFSSGSLPTGWLLLMLVPDLMGGSGSFGQPSFFAHYNLAEVTGYVGVLPLAAATALLGRLRLRPRLPEWVVWHLMALVGVLLALGGNTPLGHLLVHVPLFGAQRLQSRNILVADLALAVLLAYWVDELVSEQSRRFLRACGRRRVDLEKILGVAPPLAVIAVAVLGLSWDAGLFHWLGVSHAAIGVDGRLKPWLVPSALIAAGAAAIVVFGRRLPRRLRSRWVGGFIALDLVIFTMLAVVAVLPGIGRSASGSTSHGATTARGVPSGQSGGRAVPPTLALRPVASLGYPGRFAIYDPNQLDASQLPLLGGPDLNANTGAPSVQGYSSIVAGFYAAGTGSHQATGEGQDVLSPRAIGDGTLDSLDTSVLLTVSAYLITPAGGLGHPAGTPQAGQRDIAANRGAAWYFGAPLDVSRLKVPDQDAARDAAAGTRIGLLTSRGSTRWLPVSAASASMLAISLPHPVPSVAVLARAGGRSSRLGAPAIVDSDGSKFVADGQLQNVLAPPRWGFAGLDGSFAVFADHFATGPLSIVALPGRSASGASVRRLTGSAAEPATAAVLSPHGARIVRSVAAIPGWSATWRPRHGPATTLTVRRVGLVQAVDVPPGRGVVTWSYAAPRFTVGFAVSLGAIALIFLLLTGRSSPGRRKIAARVGRRAGRLSLRKYRDRAGFRQTMK